MRAKMPAKEGFADRNGVKLHYEIYGHGPETIVFVPPWSITHARIYKAQLPYFSERFRCVTYDGRGNGKSGRPERVKGAILAGSAASIGPGYPYMTPQHFLAESDGLEGWNKYNRAYWLTNYPDFADYFVRQIFSEPHSTRQIEEGIDWANDTTGPVLAKTVEARLIPPDFDVSEAMYRKIRCPLLMFHGDNDQVQPYARAKFVSEITGAEFVTFPGGGHNPLGRFPAKCNALIADFIDRKLDIKASPKPAFRTGKSRKVLYLSSPIGLGHGARDTAFRAECPNW